MTRWLSVAAATIGLALLLLYGLYFDSSYNQSLSLPELHASPPAPARSFGNDGTIAFSGSASPTAAVSPAPRTPFDSPRATQSLSPGCRHLVPGASAAVYSPSRWLNTTSASQPLPLVTGEHVASVWFVQLCGGGDSHPPQYFSSAEDRRRYCNGCDGTLRVSRLAGCPASAAREQRDGVSIPLDHGVSWEARRDAFGMGPDELAVRLEGAEFLSLQGTHHGDCEYSFPFSITIPGQYHLSMLAVRADWDAVSSIRAGYPPLTLDDLLGARYMLPFGDARLGTEVQAWVLRNASLMRDAPPLITAIPPLLAPCSQPAPRGRWVRTLPLEGMYNTSPVVPRSFYVPQPGFEHYTPQLTGLVWRPYACWSSEATRSTRPPTHGSRHAASCLAGKRLQFQGDSQTRYLFGSFLKLHCNISVTGEPLESICAADFGGCPALVEACFHSDAFGTRALGPPTAPYADLLVANFGQHPMASMHVPLLSYGTAMQAIYNTSTGAMAALQRRSNVSRAIVWVETYPFPIRNE